MSATERNTIQLPIIRLDTTLTDLYKLASPRNSGKHLAHVHGFANCGVALGAQVPRNLKYQYQDGDFLKTPLLSLAPSNKVSRRLLSIKYLSTVPQRDTFISGDSSVVFFDIDADRTQQTAHGRREAEATIAVLERSQRPRLVHCPGPASIPLKDSGIDLIAGFKVAIDGLEGCQYPIDVDLEKHWFLNSKAALAGSGLASPPTVVIDVDGYPIRAEDCCDICRVAKSLGGEDVLSVVPRSCRGPRGYWVGEKERMIVSAVASRRTPFVLKSQQTFGGSGTWIIRNSQQRKQLLDGISRDDGFIRRILCQVNVDNQHLQPGSMVLSDCVEDIKGNYGVTFFVTDTGDLIFMGVSEQLLASDGKAWTGSVIDYEKQAMLRERFSPLMKETAHWLSDKHGYHGPVGMDILEAKEEYDTNSHGGKDSTLQVVDLNVRVSGSMSLPLLKSHFMSRNLLFASMSMVTMRQDRWEFISRWRRDFESGQIVILSWYYDQETNMSLGSIVVGGEDENRLNEIIGKVHKSTQHVSF